MTVKTATLGAPLPPAVRRAFNFFALGFLIVGLPRLYTNTVAFSLFLTHWEPQFIPITYVGAAVTVPIGGALWLWLQSRLSLRLLLPLALGFNLFVDVSACLALEAFADHPVVGRWLSMALAVWVEVEWTLVSLVFWGLAERVFRLREAKGGFGLIAGGEPLAILLGGLTVPLLLQATDVVALLWVSVASLTAGLLLLLWLLKHERERVGEDEDTANGAAAPPEEHEARKSRRYLKTLLALVVVGVVIELVVDTAFFVGADARFGEPQELASFLGVFFAVVGLVSLVGNLLAAGWLQRRFGVAAALLGLPLAIALLSAVAAAVGMNDPGGTGLFALLLAAKLVDEAGRAGVFQPAFLVLYQPLPASTRLRAQGLVEGVYEPFAAGAAGVALLGLAAIGLGSVVPLLLTACLLSVLWLGLAWSGVRSYMSVLAVAIARRRLDVDEWGSDGAARSALLKALESAYTGDIIYALRTLSEDDGAVPEVPIDRLLEHDDTDVRLSVLAWVERRRPPGAQKLLLTRLARPALRGRERGATLRALAAVAELHARAHLLEALRGEDADARDDALVALMGHGGIEGVLSAGAHLQALLHSSDPDQRRAAARIIARLQLPGLTRHLRELISDPDPGVARAAVRAALSASSPLLIEPLLKQLRNPALCGPACTALARIGEAASTALVTRYRKAASTPQVRRHIIDTLGRIGGEQAGDLLYAVAQYARPRLALRAARAIHSGHCALPPESHTVLVERASESSRALLGLLSIAPLEGERAALLRAALEDDLTCARERLCLALIAERPEVDLPGLARGLRGSEPSRRAYALELLESRLPRPRRALVRELLESEPPIAEPVTLEAQAYFERLDATEGVSDWTRHCAHAALIEGPSAPPQPSGDFLMMPMIEKVMVMRSVTLFADVPGELLNELAGATEEIEAPAGTTLIREGETGSTLYVVVDGEVAVTRAGRHVATIGARDVFGELAALDPEPRSASVTALADVRLLTLGQDHLEALMADDIEFVRGILRTLCRRLRANAAGAAEAGRPA